MASRLEKSSRLCSGEEVFALAPSGEEGVQQMKAILGLGDLVTNVNLPNRGQIPNLPFDAVVETNARFTSDDVRPVFAGNVPQNVLGLMAATVANQENTVAAVLERNLDRAFVSFLHDPLMTAGIEDARTLYQKMLKGTEKYLEDYQK